MPKIDNTTTKEVGQQIKTIRKSLKISQGKLAADLGITFQQLQKYEKGVSKLSVDRFKQIANLLGVPPSYFLDGSTELSHQMKDIMQYTKFINTVKRLVDDKLDMSYFFSLAVQISKIQSIAVRDILLEFAKAAAKNNN